METATFAAGCFWGVEVLFRQTPGVLTTQVGYTGGHLENPTYQQVCAKESGHAEAVQLTYDPDKISYEALLLIFWQNHNPTTVDQQGPDIGHQYRSAVFFHNTQQKELALAIKKALQESEKFSSPIVTEICAASTFYPAEEYHQQYLEKKGLQTCTINTKKTDD